MTIHPIEYRYGSQELRKIFDVNSRLKFMIEVEIAILKSLEKYKIIPDGASNIVEDLVKNITIEDVKRWERVTKHETMALVMAMAEAAGEYGRFIHLGATSNDILDTALALQIKDASKVISKKSLQLIISLLRLAWKERRTACIGRTHGRAAIPTTFGYRLLQYVDELVDAYLLFNQFIEQATVGKYSGAIGIYAELGKIMKELEKNIMDILGIKPAVYSTQIIPRNKLSNLIYSMVLISTALEHLATEIRNLQRSGIDEVYEPYGKKQVGSSVMPHKRNPILSEKVCGLARILRSYINGVLENIVLEHERDLTNSSFERVIIPEIFLILDEQLDTMRYVVENLVINKEKMLENIKKEEPWIYFDLIIQRITVNGGDRQKAHSILRELYLKKANIDEIFSNDYIKKYLHKQDVSIVTDLKYYTKLAAWKVETLIKEYCSRLNISLDSIIS